MLFIKGKQYAGKNHASITSNNHIMVTHLDTYFSIHVNFERQTRGSMNPNLKAVLSDQQPRNRIGHYSMKPAVRETQ